MLKFQYFSEPNDRKSLRSTLTFHDPNTCPSSGEPIDPATSVTIIDSNVFKRRRTRDNNTDVHDTPDTVNRGPVLHREPFLVIGVVIVTLSTNGIQCVPFVKPQSPLLTPVPREISGTNNTLRWSHPPTRFGPTPSQSVQVRHRGA